MTIEDIRARFPDPVSTLARKDGRSYCVGGALCLVTAPPDSTASPFPGKSRLAEALGTLNPALSYGRAADFAFLIIVANDEGQFDVAWRYAAEALAWRTAP